MTRFIMLTLAFFSFSQSELSAQPSVDAVALVSNKTHSATPKKTRKKSEEMPSYLRTQRAMPAIYTGLSIELTVSEVPLERDNPLFMQFGNVVTQKTTSGMYAYHVLLAFGSEKEAERFTETIIKPRAPHARLVSFEKGKMKKKKKEKVKK